jgi:hypothetical protein
MEEPSLSPGRVGQQEVCLMWLYQHLIIHVLLEEHSGTRFNTEASLGCTPPWTLQRLMIDG